jgi:hypothetical protein
MTGERRNRGDKNRWCPSPQDRATVEDLASQGVTREVIASKMGVSFPTLAKHCLVELERGRAKNKNMLFGIMMKHAVTTANPNASISATKYLLSTRHGVYDGDTSRIAELEVQVSALEAKLARKDEPEIDHDFPEGIRMPPPAMPDSFDVQTALASIVGKHH